MGISMISNERVAVANGLGKKFQSPMGISMISNGGVLHWTAVPKFQSPMGISMISNLVSFSECSLDQAVSIPNGDKHDFKPIIAIIMNPLRRSFNPQWG